ncbi:MAG: SUMF1/EgtB/PvdO family nonheme iron enzyme [Chloroflexi bacterium]|nr:SUMF1/EgtB/PvdO family nonheme iron enzyme [Chloroflexota bacterium]
MSARSPIDTVLERANWMAGVVVAIIAYLAFAYTANWWPFLKDAQKTPEVGLTSPTSPTPTLTLKTVSVTPTANFAPKPTDTPRPTAIPTLGIGSSKISPIDGATMVYVPAGEFLMGSTDADKQALDNEKPQHRVYLDAFWIDKFEVKNTLYEKCVTAGKCQLPNRTSSYARNSYYGNSEYDNYPVIYVSLNDATTYCTWASRKLPTEAQWEKAARWVDERIYPWGDTFNKSWFNANDPAKGDTKAVGMYSNDASLYGVMDMAGNVSEWVADWYDAKYYSVPQAFNSWRNPQGPISGEYRVARGGSWLGGLNEVRVTYRRYYAPNYWLNNVGFRCVE